MPRSSVVPGDCGRCSPGAPAARPRDGGTDADHRCRHAAVGVAGANVIAPVARAHVNMRVMVGETVDGALERIRRTVKDPHVEVVLVSGHGPSPCRRRPTGIRPDRGDGRRGVPGTVAIPYVMLAATDSRHFHRVWPRVYRFTPFRMSDAQRAAIHGVDERIGIDDLHDGIAWYRRLLEQL